MVAVLSNDWTLALIRFFSTPMQAARDSEESGFHSAAARLFLHASEQYFT
jgi:hypothetical protein